MRCYLYDIDDCDIAFPLDKSISRVHTKIAISPLEPQHISKPGTAAKQVIMIQDCSKFGTWVNDDKVGPEGKAAKHGDLLKLGSADTVLKYLSFVCLVIVD